MQSDKFASFCAASDLLCSSAKPEELIRAEFPLSSGHSLKPNCSISDDHIDRRRSALFGKTGAEGIPHGAGQEDDFPSGLHALHAPFR